MRNLVLSALSFFCISVTFSQLTMTGGMTPQQYVENVLAGPGVIISNAMFNDNAGYTGNQIRKFDYVGNQINFTSGLVMGSGGVVNAAGTGAGIMGPNNLGSYSLAPTNNLTSDAQLAQYSNSLYNVGRLEFDFVPAGNTVSFNFKFASDEYNEFVCSSFFDVFGFFVTGPNPAGGTYNNTNLALVPGTTIPITINTINNGTVGSSGTASRCASANPNWQQSNQFFQGAPGAHFQCDGITNTINITFNVICGETYHFKFAIADVGDAAYDSWVFLESGSFTSDAVLVSVATVSGDTNVIEGCTEANIVFTRPIEDTLDTLIINYEIYGDAIDGVDFPTLVNPITFLPGQDSVILTLAPIQDNMTEGPEYVTIRVFIVNLCGDTVISEGTIWIIDKPTIVIDENDPVGLCMNDSILMTAVASGGFAPYTYTWSNGKTGSEVYGDVDMNGPTDFIVTATDQCGFQQQDTVTVTMNQTLKLDSLVAYPATACNPTGATAAYVSGYSGTPVYNWSGPGPNSPNSISATVFQNLSAGWYYFSVSDNNCIIKDSIEVKQELGPIADFTASITDGCTPLEVTFTNTSQNTSSYAWNFDHGNQIATNDKTTHTITFTESSTVTLVASHAGCSDSKTIQINLVKCGCMDPLAINYDPTAVVDDGSCIYPYPTVTPPNVFTPDGDDVNEIYFLTHENVLDLEYWIFNRWGNLMYHSTSLLDKDGWNGKSGSTPASEGVYFIKFIAKGYGDTKVEGHTFFHLNRK